MIDVNKYGLIAKVLRRKHWLREGDLSERMKPPPQTSPLLVSSQRDRSRHSAKQLLKKLHTLDAIEALDNPVLNVNFL